MKIGLPRGAISSSSEVNRRNSLATLNIKNLPDPLYHKLKARAEREHRSIAQQVTHILEEALRDPEPLSILELQGLGKEIWKGMDAAAYVDEERRSWD